ncbi:hypothetical protein [Dyella mobilis]|uniref:hypothetical protein n=1 Tax=Dyella mobilis TaxID=1849582 RepID=UPI001EF96E2F|nr:hypothetical protein [Dyella mobilis]
MLIELSKKAKKARVINGAQTFGLCQQYGGIGRRRRRNRRLRGNTKSHGPDQEPWLGVKPPWRHPDTAY